MTGPMETFSHRPACITIQNPMPSGSEGTGTKFFLIAGGATAGGGALGALVGGVAWAAARDIRRLWGWLTHTSIPDLPLASLGTFALVGTFLGGFVGFLTWLYEH